MASERRAEASRTGSCAKSSEACWNDGSGGIGGHSHRLVGDRSRSVTKRVTNSQENANEEGPGRRSKNHKRW